MPLIMYEIQDGVITSTAADLDDGNGLHPLDEDQLEHLECIVGIRRLTKKQQDDIVVGAYNAMPKDGASLIARLTPDFAVQQLHQKYSKIPTRMAASSQVAVDQINEVFYDLVKAALPAAAKGQTTGWQTQELNKMGFAFHVDASNREHRTVVITLNGKVVVDRRYDIV